MSGEKIFGCENWVFLFVFWALFGVGLVFFGLLVGVLAWVSMLVCVTFNVVKRDVCVC